MPELPMTVADHSKRLRDFALVSSIRAGGWQAPVLWFDRAGPALGLAIMLFGLPLLFLGNAIDTAQVSQIGRYAALTLVAIGLDLVWGYTGILSLCQALFFTLGGYACGMYLAMHGPLDGDHIPRALYVVSSQVSGMTLPWFWKPFDSEVFSLIAILAVPGLAAFLFSWFAFRSRVKGVYFSMITQAVTVAAWLTFCRNDLQMCGTNGLTNFTQVLGADLREPATKLGLCMLSILAMAATAVFALWLARTRFGRILVAIRDSEARLRFAGYQPMWFKTAVFTIAAVLAGIGGALYTPQTGIITPSNMMAVESIWVVVWVAVGGRGTIHGAIIGALVVNFLRAWLSSARSIDWAWMPDWLLKAVNFVLGNLPSLWPYLLGGLFVSVVLFFPDGIVGLWRRLVARAKEAKA